MAPAQAQALPTGQENTIVPEAVRDGIDLQINGEHYRHTGDPQMPLLWYLRDVLRLTGTKYGGEHGESGADLVLLDGKAVSAITQTMAKLAGKQVVTVEGLAANDGTLHPLQQAFIEHGGFQCGYCTPGQICSAVAMLAEFRNGNPSAVSGPAGAPPELTEAELRERMSGNLCRCGAYVGIRDAIQQAFGAPLP